MRTKRESGYEAKKARWGWAFVAPGIAFFAVFSFFPILNALWTSLFNKKLLSLKAPKFIGLENYFKVLGGEEFWNSAAATGIFAVGSFLPLVVLSLLLAVLISSRSRFTRGLQLLFYSPAVLSSVVAALIWMLMFDPRGLANQAVNSLFGTSGIDHQWLADAGMVRVSTMIVYVWKYIGYFTILYITGIGKIPKGVMEAARIDGADGWRSFRFIVLPLLKPTTALVSIMAMIQCLKTFSTQYLFTQSGAPTGPINVITLNIYNTAMRDLNIGRASVMSVILFLAMLALTGVQLRVSKSDDVSY
jgi:multiple sugar transport system permease protein